jgi:hypothetical protein
VSDLPYPESTDDINQGANDIKALALELGARGGAFRIQGAQQQVMNTDSAGRFFINFPVPFSAPPVAVLAQSGEAGPFVPFVSNPANAGQAQFRLWYQPTNSWAGAGAAVITWLAIGPA